jgi:hypothetical protein
MMISPKEPTAIDMSLYRHYITKTVFYLVILAVSGSVLGLCVAALLVGKALLAPAGKFDAFSTDGCLGEAPYSEPMLEQKGHLKFPQSARHLWANSAASWGDCFIFLNFEIAVDDLQPFLASTYITSIEERQGNELSSFKNLFQSDASWTLDNQQIYLYGDSNNGNLITQYVVIDQSDYDFYGVYLITWLM